MRRLLTLTQILELNAIRVRALVLKRWLGAMGLDCHVELGVRFRAHEGIRLGDRCFIGRNVDLHGGGGGGGTNGIDLGNDVRIREGCYIDAQRGWIRLAQRVFLGPHCILYGQGGLSIGRNTLIAGNTTIIPANHAFGHTDVPLRDQGETAKGIVIEEDVWVGAGCLILDGVRIGHDAVIGGGAVVTRDVPPWAIAMGAPARVIRMRSHSA